MNSWGYSMWVDVKNCDHNKIISYTNIEKFAKKLVSDIDMIAYGEPYIVHFGSDDKQGYSLCQLIETSCITAHFAEESDRMFLDVFSCKDFKLDVVLECVREFFGKNVIIRYGVVERGIDS